MSWCGTCYTSHWKLKFHRQLDQRRAKANPALNEKWRNKNPDKNKYEVARAGDSLAVPFQCNLCVFRRITDRDPRPTSATNVLLLHYIRIANLDSFWSRAPRTIPNDLGHIKRSIQNKARVGLPRPYYDPGPAPPHDACGYEADIALLMDSQEKGTYHVDHKEWQSVRKL